MGGSKIKFPPFFQTLPIFLRIIGRQNLINIVKLRLKRRYQALPTNVGRLCRTKADSKLSCKQETAKATFQNADLLFPLFTTQDKAKSIGLTLTVATNRQLSGSPPGGSAPNNGCPHKSK